MFDRPDCLRLRRVCIAGATICVAAAGLAADTATCAEPAQERLYSNRLQPIDNPGPLLADHPEFVQPIQEQARFEASALIDEADATLAVRAWRFSYNARGIIEIPNRLRGDRTALIVVHPWGIDDDQGWKSPEPAGVAFFCTPEKNQIYHRHIRKVVNPFVQSLRERVSLVMYSLPGSEDPIRKKLYRSIRQRTSPNSRRAAQPELLKRLAAFEYSGEPVPVSLTLSPERPASIDYMAQFPGLDAGARYNHEGFWNLPIPVVSGLKTDTDDVVIYDADGYSPLRQFLKEQGIEHVLLCGYATDMCVCGTTAGYENLRKDFNVFLVGDATLATFPANATPAYATNASLSFASLKLLITQVSWIRPLDGKQVAETSDHD